MGTPVSDGLDWPLLLASSWMATHRDLFALPLDQLTPVAFKCTLG